MKKTITCPACGRKIDIDVDYGEKADVMCKCGHKMGVTGNKRCVVEKPQR